MGKDIGASLAHAVSVGEGTGKNVIDARDVDEALKFLGANAGIINLEDVDEKRLMRKVDWTLMPLIFLCYFLQYSDKTLINYASVMGIIEDTNLPPDSFSNLAMVFYVSFLVCEPLQTYCIQRFQLRNGSGRTSSYGA